MIMVILGPLTARWTEPAVRGLKRLMDARRTRREPAGTDAVRREAAVPDAEGLPDPVGGTGHPS